MREVLDIIDGANIMEFNTPRSSNGDLFRVEDDNLDFCYMWRLRRCCGYCIKVWLKEFYEDFYFIWSIGDGRDC